MDSEMKRKETKRWTANKSYSFDRRLKMHKGKWVQGQDKPDVPDQHRVKVRKSRTKTRKSINQHGVHRTH